MVEQRRLEEREEVNPDQGEISRRQSVIKSILEATAENRTIKLPPFDPQLSQPSPTVASVTVGLEPNPYGGIVGELRYQFEGEEDLLHLIVTRLDGNPIAVESARELAAFLFEGVPPALVWLKPGEYSQHFYLGHDDLAQYVSL